MLDSITIATSGMRAQQQQIDTISNNVANISTTAFRSTGVAFTSLISADASQSAVGTIGRPMGVAGSGQTINLTSGHLLETQRPFDFAILGEGYFELVDDLGNLVYTRDGRFRLDESGYITSFDGLPLSSLIQIPNDSFVSIQVDGNGEVHGLLADNNDPVNLGSIDLAYFMSPQELNSLGRGLYASNDKSGDPIVGTPIERGSMIRQGYLESSNVDMVTELTSLVLAQKAYGMNSRLIQASDELLSLINNLRRS